MSTSRKQEDQGISIAHLLNESYAVSQGEHYAREAIKAGNLRAGNSGAMVKCDDGSYLPAGSCVRVAHLRTLGVELEAADLPTLTMWDGGFNNEKFWLEKLTKVWKGPVLQEDDIPVEWTTSSGVKVTGRPDIVLLEATGLETPPIPVLGLELKSIGSIWTLRDVSLNHPAAPKFAHLCQAGHYSRRLGEKFGSPEPLPYKIIYSAYVNFPVAGWAKKQFPLKGSPRSEFCAYNDKGEIKNTKPHHTIYDIAWDGDNLKFRLEQSDILTGLPCSQNNSKWVVTPVTWSGIQSFFERASLQQMQANFPDRPLTLSGHGVEADYSNCGYCPIQEVCTAYEEKGYNRWVQEVRRHIIGTRTSR